MTRNLRSPSRRLSVRDALSVSSIGIRTRKMRAALSALGIAIGAGAIVGILGISSSSQAALLAEIDALGTNLLTVSTGQTTFGETAALPIEAPARIGVLPGVESTESTGEIDVPVYRNPFIPAVNTNGIGLFATTLGLSDALGSGVARGVFLNAATARHPVVVLGALAAGRLGIDELKTGTRIWIGSQWFSVAGILEPSVLAPEIDAAALIGFEAAQEYLGFDGHPTTIYVRTDPDDVEGVHGLLTRAANPENPSEVEVSRPSDALVARAKTESALNALFLGLGGISLLVGSVGVANTMIVSVLERRSEIGLRRALGATRAHIRSQFLTEAILLSLLGGGAGVAAGAIATIAYASAKGWMVVIPAVAWGGGLAASLVIGAIAGLLPALRAARMSPTTALWMS